jgi:D-glycero-D-manno-heptose 1,7-bisphosphate phosphatase
MKLVILGRNGVINEVREGDVKSPGDWRPIPGSLEAIADLNQAGYRVIIATNQPGLARGLFDINALNAIHRKLHDELERAGGHVDAIFFCPHRPRDNCDCRMPKPGLLRQISERFYCDLSEVPVIGDSKRHLVAARAVGAQPVLVLTGHGLETRERLTETDTTPIFPDLAMAVEALLRDENPEG